MLVGIGYGRHDLSIAFETRLIRELFFGTPIFEIKRRTSHDIIDFLIFMKVLGKRRGVLFSQIMRNLADSQIHLTKPPRIDIAFLPDNRNLLSVSLIPVYKFHGLDKYTAIATARVSKVSVFDTIER